jgi:hypothetical protein
MKRPMDMLMFIGEYFKLHVDETERVVKENTDDKSSVQDAFFLTADILNSLATAIKMYIDDARQELRISIALARNPLFEEGTEQIEVIKG